MRISIVIPAYNEEPIIGKLVSYLVENGGAAVAEVLVIDGGSTDGTMQAASAAGARALLSPRKGRAAQMNFGASVSMGEVLYFVHADSFPPKNFAADILKALSKGFDLGRYRTRFMSPKPILRINEWFTRLDLFICYGGDQTLFIRKAFFDQLGGFRSDMLIMEEYEFCSRARSQGRYIIMKDAALISARKYEKNSWFQVQLANYTVVKMYRKGVAQQQLVAQYKKMLKF